MITWYDNIISYQTEGGPPVSSTDVVFEMYRASMVMVAVIMVVMMTVSMIMTIMIA